MYGIIEFFHQSFQRGHPTCRQVAVLQEHPLAPTLSLVDEPLGLVALALAQVAGIQLLGHLFLLCEPQDCRDRVGACGQ